MPKHTVCLGLQMQNAVPLIHQIRIFECESRQVHHLVLVVRIDFIGSIGVVCVRRLLGAARDLAVAGERTATRSGQRSLIRWLHGNYQVRTVGQHHVRYLRNNNNNMKVFVFLV